MTDLKQPLPVKDIACAACNPSFLQSDALLPLDFAPQPPMPVIVLSKMGWLLDRIERTNARHAAMHLSASMDARDFSPAEGAEWDALQEDADMAREEARALVREYFGVDPERLAALI